jgi:glucokinase
VDVALAIELGTQWLDVGLVSRQGRMIDRRRLEEGLDERGRRFAFLTGAITELRQRADELGMPIVAGGMVLPSGDGRDDDLVRPSRLQDRISELAGVPVVAEGDGRAFALLEGSLGVAVGVENFVAILVSETVRGGVVIDGRLLSGELGGAGQVGHVVVSPNGHRCRCGARGCLTAEVSEHGIQITSGRNVQQPTYEVMRRAGTLLGRAVATVATLLDVRLAVVGGSVVDAFAAPLVLAAQQEIDERCHLSFSRGTRLLSARAPGPRGVLSAAAVAWYHER